MPSHCEDVLSSYLQNKSEYLLLSTNHSVCWLNKVLLVHSTASKAEKTPRGFHQLLLFLSCFSEQAGRGTFLFPPSTSVSSVFCVEQVCGAPELWQSVT